MEECTGQSALQEFQVPCCGILTSLPSAMETTVEPLVALFRGVVLGEPTRACVASLFFQGLHASGPSSSVSLPFPRTLPLCSIPETSSSSPAKSDNSNFLDRVIAPTPSPERLPRAGESALMGGSRYGIDLDDGSGLEKFVICPIRSPVFSLSNLDPDPDPEPPAPSEILGGKGGSINPETVLPSISNLASPFEVDRGAW